MLRVIIIDDELMGINTLKTLIEKYTQGLKIVASSTDPEKGIELIEDFKPDVVFLDISMPKMNAFELLERIKYKEFKLIFTTAHATYAIQAVKTHAHDYLLKPIDIDELKECVTKLTNASDEKKDPLKKSHKKNNIELSVKDGVVFIKIKDIIRLEASGSYTVFYLEDNTKHIASRNLKEYEAILDESIFYRCHQSHIINLHKVVKMLSSDGLYAQMSDGSKPEISKKNKEIFLEKLKGM